MSKRNNRFWDSLNANNSQYLAYYNRLLELSISMWDWKNLPESVDPRFLELTLFGTGFCLFFNEPDIGFLTLPCSIGGQLSVYNIPVDRRAYANNGFQRNCSDKDSILIFNNYLHQPSFDIIMEFSKKLWQLDRIISVNVNAQKTPILILSEESQLLSLKNMYMEYDGNQPVIFASKSFDPNAFKVLKTDAPYISDKIYELKLNIWCEALTCLGIPNLPTNKRERLIVDEVDRMSGAVMASRQSRLKSRKHACEQINKMFGLNIDCDFSQDFISDNFIDVPALDTEV